MMQIIFPEGPTRFILPSLQETGQASEDPNLPIDDRRKNHTALQAVMKH